MSSFGNSNEDTTIEQEFVTSWDGIERFYTRFIQVTDPDYWGYLNSILPFITELRNSGYDHKLRAGQSLWRFILSRARKHGLRDGQPYLLVDVRPEGTMTIHYPDLTEEVEIQVDHVGVTEPLKQLLERLLQHPID